MPSNSRLGKRRGLTPETEKNKYFRLKYMTALLADTLGVNLLFAKFTAGLRVRFPS